MRPESPEEFVGQEEVFGPGTPLRLAVERDDPPSCVFWGPPGSGKTTLARIIARATASRFLEFSAVLSGIKEVKEVMERAGEERRLYGKRTIVFVDEIHRFNKAQQDAFLPRVERGDVVLIGATTENPSFEVIGPLLSRLSVFVLSPLSPADIAEIVRRALADEERGLGRSGIGLAPGALEALAGLADGDARRALNMLEAAAALLEDEARRATQRPLEASPARGIKVSAGLPAEGPPTGGQEERTGEGRQGEKETPCPASPAAPVIDAALLSRVIRRKSLLYDRAGEEHYNLISALHKSLRNSDPDAALYWLARMLEGGEDPLYLARRMVRFASEDVGLADPGALRITLAARDAMHFLGRPEGDLALAEAAVYLALAPKSNALYAAMGAVRADIQREPALPVPLHIRNAPTRLMKELGYGRGYEYAHDFEEGTTAMTCLPDNLAGRRYYTPSGSGLEKKIAERLEELRRLREEMGRRQAGKGGRRQRSGTAPPRTPEGDKGPPPEAG